MPMRGATANHLFAKETKSNLRRPTLR